MKRIILYSTATVLFILAILTAYLWGVRTGWLYGMSLDSAPRAFFEYYDLQKIRAGKIEEIINVKERRLDDHIYTYANFLNNSNPELVAKLSLLISPEPTYGVTSNTILSTYAGILNKIRIYRQEYPFVYSLPDKATEKDKIEYEEQMQLMRNALEHPYPDR